MAYQQWNFERQPSYRQSQNSTSRLSALDFVKLDDRSPTRSLIQNTPIHSKLTHLQNQLTLFQTSFRQERENKAELYQKLKKYLSENLNVMAQNRSQIEQIRMKTCNIADGIQSSVDNQAVYQEDLLHYSQKLNQIQKQIEAVRQKVVARPDREEPRKYQRSRSSRKTYQ